MVPLGRSVPSMKQSVFSELYEGLSSLSDFFFAPPGQKVRIINRSGLKKSVTCAYNQDLTFYSSKKHVQCSVLTER